MRTTPHPLPRVSRTALVAAVAAVSAGGLAACSSSAGNATPPAAPSTSTSTASSPSSTASDTRTTKPGSDTKTTESRTTTPTEPPRTTTTGSAPAPGNGFDGPAFQKAMSAVGVAPTGTTSGRGGTGIGAMSYKFTMNGSSVASINCAVQAEAADVQQSDQDAQTLAGTFLTACADFNFPTDASEKSQANTFITSKIAGLQGEQPPLTTTIGPVALSLGKAAPGFYFLNMRH